MLVQPLTIHSLSIFPACRAAAPSFSRNLHQPAFTIVSARQLRPAPLACRVEARSESPKYLSVRLRATRYGATVFVLRSAPSEDWRRGRDSNPRRVLARSGFQDRRDRPLCHLSNDRLDLWIDGLLDERSSSIPPIHLSNYPAIQPIPHRLARQEGLEPPTNGFGDRYSAN